MRQKTELSESPQSFTVTKEGQTAVITFYTDVEEEQRDGTTVYTAIAWDLRVPWQEHLKERIGSNQESWFRIAQDAAYSLASSEVRAVRDKMLADSDASMALDRLGLIVPSGSSFTAWLSFLRGLGQVLTGKIALYRQALRDIPQQPGFPYDIEWPEKP